MLIVLLLIGAVFYLMFLEFYIKHFPNGPNSQAAFDLAVQMVEDYGTTLEPEEFEIVKATWPRLLDEADGYIAAHPVAQKYSLQTYADYEVFLNENWPSSENQERVLLRNYLWAAQTGNIYGRLLATDSYIRRYESAQAQSVGKEAVPNDVNLSQGAYSHAVTLFFGQDEAWRNILPYELPEATSSYFGHLLVWMVLSVCLLLSPVLVRDRMRTMRPLQWSARRGRDILTHQFAAAMLSAFLLCTINLLIFGGMFSTNHVGIFAHCKMFSFMLTGFSWVNLTYGLWCAAIMGLCYLLCFGVAGIAFALSRFSGNYIAMLLKLIPVFVAGAILSPKLISSAFYYRNPLYQWTQIPMIELVVTGTVLLFGLGLCLLCLTRQRRQDLLSA